eukprot:SAG22_NODE_1975_length_3221_cov_2.215247_4_plen_283_part_00
MAGPERSVQGGAAAKKESNFVGAMGNFSIQYNLSAASIALPFLQSHPHFAQPKWVHYVGLGSVFVGAVLGMLVMGFLGDLLGRKRAMVVTLAIQVLGAVGCSLLTFGSVPTIYTVFCASRCLLGIGVGGMYPLSASHAAEGSSSSDGNQGSRVGWAFFWQTPGSMAPYVVAVILLLAIGDRQCAGITEQAPCLEANTTVHSELCTYNASGNELCTYNLTAPTTLPALEYRLITGLGIIPPLIVSRRRRRRRRQHFLPVPAKPAVLASLPAGHGVRRDEHAGL